MRRALWFFALLLVVGLTQAGAFATGACDGAPCTTISFHVLDPHGNAIENYLVWAKYNANYQQTGRTGTDGRVTLEVPTQPSSNCWIVGGSPDEFLTGSAIPGRVCGDTNVELRPLYRVRSWITPRETVIPNLGKFPYHLEVYANSRTNPAPFAGDALTYTLTYHNGGSPVKKLYLQSVFAAPTATLTSGVWKYIWKVDLEPVVTEPTMIHVDWGDKTNFGQMMDCRMIFAGFGLDKQPVPYRPLSTITLTGNGFGNTRGFITLNQATRTEVDPIYIQQWTDTVVKFILPPNITSNTYVRLTRADGLAPWCMGGGVGLPTNQTILAVKTL